MIKIVNISSPKEEDIKIANKRYEEIIALKINAIAIEEAIENTSELI